MRDGMASAVSGSAAIVSSETFPMWLLPTKVQWTRGALYAMADGFDPI
jgi:hypothetical protein